MRFSRARLLTASTQPSAISSSAAASLGSAIISRYATLLQQDVTTTRLSAAHEIVRQSLETIDPSLQLYTFGSSAVLGFHEPRSDVDFVALRPEDVEDGRGGDCTTQLAKALQTELLAKLAKHLKTNNFTWQIEEVRRARVPVVKVKAPNVDFDITAHRRNGVRNSALLHAYFVQHPASRWLSVAIKGWSKDTGMNGPLGFLTSYGFNLMVAYYLLHGSKDVQSAHHLAPFLFVNKDTLDVSKIPRLPQYLPLSVPEDTAWLGALVCDFLSFYLHRFPFDTHVVSLSREDTTMKTMLNWTKTAEDIKRQGSHERAFYRLCIEDPYEVDLNVGRNVSPFKLDILKKHLEKGLATGLGLTSP